MYDQLDMFPEHSLDKTNFKTESPINREKITGQNEVVFNYLSKGNTITQYIAMKKFGISRLSARVYDLRKIGNVLICDRMIKEAGFDVKEYSLRPFKVTK